MLALKMHLFVIMLLLDFLNTPPFAKKKKNKNKNTHIVLSHHVTLVLFSLRVFLFFSFCGLVKNGHNVEI